jgi:hypothetical protein
MNVTEIKDYIIKHYPDSCLAENNKDGRVYCEEELFEVCEDFFYYEKLNWCGCGSPETAKRVVRDYLEATSLKYDEKRQALKKRFGVGDVYGNELMLCLAYAIDGAGLTEHGSSIGCAWVTDEGKMFLWLLKNNKELDEE